MKLAKALVALNMARTGGEAQRLVKQGSILVGGCIPPCNARLHPYTCNCGGWRKVTNPTEEIKPDEVIRIGSGNWRFVKDDKKFDQLPGIGWCPAQ